MTTDLYHGTSKRSASAILRKGFNLRRQVWGRGWGNGVYLSGTAKFATTWGPVLLRCQMKSGTRILWHDSYEVKVINYLKKEFKYDISKPDFWKHLPANKQLTKNELINLWRYLTEKCYQHPNRFKKGTYEHLAKNYSRIYQQLRLHQFQGVGNRDVQWPEVLVFNPSQVVPLSAHQWDRNSESLSHSLEL